jgi:hypothetical protein
MNCGLGIRELLQNSTQGEGIKLALDVVLAKIFRTGSVPKAASNILCGYQDLAGKVGVKGGFKMSVEKAELEAIVDRFLVAYATGKLEEFYKAVLGAPLRMNLALPNYVEDNNHTRNGNICVVLDDTHQYVTQITNITATEVAILRRYEALIGELCEDLKSPGQIARAIETALLNAPLVLEQLDNKNVFMTANANPLEFLFKGIGLKRMNSLLRAGGIRNLNYLTGDNADDAKTRYTKKVRA